MLYNPPKWGDISGESVPNNVTSAVANTPITYNFNNPADTALKFCNVFGEALYSYSVGPQLSYPNFQGVGFNGSQWSDTSYQIPFTQIECYSNEAGTTTTEVSTTTINVEVLNQGLNFHEQLFVIAVIVFLLSFSIWGKISFTNVDLKKP